MADGQGGPAGTVQAHLEQMRGLARTVQGMAGGNPWMPDDLGAQYRPSNFAESPALRAIISTMSQRLGQFQTDYKGALHHNSNYLTSVAAAFDHLDQVGADDFHRVNFNRLNGEPGQGSELAGLLDNTNHGVSTPDGPPTMTAAALPGAAPGLEDNHDPDARGPGFRPAPAEDQGDFWTFLNESNQAAGPST